jgi:DNA-directed RNA polymerase subunit RPC12/RpoP
MSGIPSRCPHCGNKKLWTEQVNAFTSGVPARNGAVRIRLISIRGLFAKPVKEKLGFYKVNYRCKNCGHKETYELLR